MRYFAAFLLLFAHLMAAAQTAAVHFQEGDWSQIQAQAQQENRPVFLYFWSPQCGPCVQLAREVWPDSAVARYYNATFFNAKVNLDSQEGKALGKRYGVRSLPTYLYFSPAGKLLHRTGGSKPAAEIMQDGRDAFDPNKAYFTLKERYQAGARGAAFLYAFSTAPGLMAEPVLYRQVGDEYLQSQSAVQLATPKNQDYIFNQYQDFEAPATQYFLRHQPAFCHQFGLAAVAKRTRGIVGNAADNYGRKNNATGLAGLQQTLKKLFPAEAAQWQALAQLHFLLAQPKRDWPAYADAALAYGRKFAAQDGYTLYEATAYLTAFVSDKTLLAKADQIIQLALAADPSALHLLTRAKLLHKLGDNVQAAAVAREAAATATRTGQNAEGATSFLAEISE